MIHPETHKVTKENGPRPAGPPDRCFYCNEPVGGTHKEDCVLREKTVVIRMVAEYTIAVPEHWDKGNIEFRRNESSWCSGNAVDELERLGDGNGCLCGLTRFEFIRDATEEDEAFSLSQDHGSHIIPAKL